MRRFSDSGQMAVELAVVFPALIAIGVIAANALLFFSECAAFDNLFRDAVRVHATSPAYGQGIEQSRAQVQESLEAAFDGPYEDLHVTVEGESAGHTRFSATIRLFPTLFGLGLKSSVFGVSLPSASHTAQLVVDCYKPGVLL